MIDDHEPETDSQQPFDFIDGLLTDALHALIWVAVGMFTTAALIFFSLNF